MHVKDVESVINGIRAEEYKKSLEVCGRLGLKVRGWSMWPMIKDGAMVEVVSCASDKVRTGDVVLTHVNDAFFCHRVCGRKGQNITTKGDELKWTDPVSGSGNLIGRIVSVEYKGKKRQLDQMSEKLGGKIIAVTSGITARLFPALRTLKRTIKRGGDQ